ncbi:MAG: helix-turn-helix transcriptional regulator, partial [Myxococcota bacterium]|nr:helix-turn-helix transcriptional regulator [Myxococcota bacterium]
EPSARLDEALFQALGATRAEKSTTRTSLEAEATSNLGGYEVRLVPLQTMGNPFGHRGSSSALLFIADPDNLDIEIDAHIQTLYGLTEAEARVARHIVSGYSVDNIAAILSRSTNTIRAQLKSAMRKCQVSSQAQLVGLIHRGLAVSV